MRYFTEIVGCLNEKKWDISKNPFARRKRPAERPCRSSAFNRFLSAPCLFSDNKIYLSTHLPYLHWNNICSDMKKQKWALISTFPFGNIIVLPTLQQIYQSLFCLRDFSRLALLRGLRRKIPKEGKIIYK